MTRSLQVKVLPLSAAGEGFAVLFVLDVGDVFRGLFAGTGERLERFADEWWFVEDVTAGLGECVVFLFRGTDGVIFLLTVLVGWDDLVSGTMFFLWMLLSFPLPASFTSFVRTSFRSCSTSAMRLPVFTNESSVAAMEIFCSNGPNERS